MKKKIFLNGEEYEVEIKRWNQEELEFEFAGRLYRFGLAGSRLSYKNESRKFFAARILPKESKQVFVDDLEAEIAIIGKAQKASGHHGGAGSLQSPMPGKIFKVLKQEGQDVKLGEPILILEAMKMEHTIKAQHDGVVKKIHFQEGAQVQGGVELCEIE